ncbi:MAG: helix-turn-helix domain-containing protein [Candidatus Omnitrophica bacterium]|nr:helix-turn-helix domain-containing protein [Candidatus Omnitrophota bacterium]
MSIELAGERLKKIRQEKGITLEEVHKKTKIQLNILKAIEGESLTNLNPTYLKGFLKIYCKFLGVDPKEYIPDYKEGSNKSFSSVYAQDQDKPLKSVSFMKNATFKLSSFRPNKKLKTIAIAVLIIIILSVVLFKIGKFISSRQKEVFPQQIVTQQKPQAQQPKLKSSESAPKMVVNEAKFPKVSSGGISLVISAKENCMVLVKVDGRVVLHRVLERGRSDSWKADKKIELDLGNAAGVDLIVNGTRFSKLGRKGQQLKGILITEKEGLKIPR